jgi:uncharacterized protein YodC (DUF2158 family)
MARSRREVCDDQEAAREWRSKLKAGDVVQLKRGGPKMTEENVGKYGMGSTKDEAKCVWFEKNKRMEGVFDPVLLTQD